MCNRQNFAYLRSIIVDIHVYLEVITNTKHANICSGSAVYVCCHESFKTCLERQPSKDSLDSYPAPPPLLFFNILKTSLF